MTKDEVVVKPAAELKLSPDFNRITFDPIIAHYGSIENLQLFYMEFLW